MKAALYALSLAALASSSLGHSIANRGNVPILGRTSIQKRQGPVSTDGRCGTGFGTVCGGDDCCSSGGYCGRGYEYCPGPACQLQYGPGCDANTKPSGPKTANLTRRKVGTIPYGKAVYDCTVDGGIALTFDDGPFEYTEDLLDILKEHGVKATFFITGHNLGKGAINDPQLPWPGLIRRMIAEGHQIGSHTWTHQRLTTLSKADFWNQMIYNEMALADILGFFPAYMRPPYSASNDTTDAWLAQLGYHTIYFNLDTEGYLNDDPTLAQKSKDIWDTTVNGKPPATNEWLQIEHDTVYQSVYNLTSYFIASLKSNGFKTLTVGECLGDPKANWYRTVPGGPGLNSTDPAPTGLPPTKDGRCGLDHGDATCRFESGASCCSGTGWCGGTTGHCDPNQGCQPLFGTCIGVPAPGLPSSAAAVVAAPSSSSKTAAQPSAAPISKDGRCGPAHGGTTCAEEPGATCCSAAGWCGATTDHCLASKGCQPLFGTCGSSK